MCGMLAYASYVVYIHRVALLLDVYGNIIT